MVDTFMHAFRTDFTVPEAVLAAVAACRIGGPYSAFKTERSLCWRCRYRSQSFRNKVQIAIEVLVALLEGDEAVDLPVIEILRDTGLPG